MTPTDRKSVGATYLFTADQIRWIDLRFLRQEHHPLWGGLFLTMCSACAERDVPFGRDVCFASDVRFAREDAEHITSLCDLGSNTSLWRSHNITAATPQHHSQCSAVISRKALQSPLFYDILISRDNILFFPWKDCRYESLHYSTCVFHRLLKIRSLLWGTAKTDRSMRRKHGHHRFPNHNTYIYRNHILFGI